MYKNTKESKSSTGVLGSVPAEAIMIDLEELMSCVALCKNWEINYVLFVWKSCIVKHCKHQTFHIVLKMFLSVNEKSPFNGNYNDIKSVKSRMFVEHGAGHITASDSLTIYRRSVSCVYSTETFIWFSGIQT